MAKLKELEKNIFYKKELVETGLNWIQLSGDLMNSEWTCLI